MSSPARPTIDVARLDGAMQRVDMLATRKGPDLSGPAIATLRAVAAQARELPAAILLVGGSDLERTRAATMVAGELGKSLLRITLAAVTSKYIGETEKNLSHVFTSAAAQDAILFFDEADALFGVRSDVKDSHDRFANVEAQGLLDRIATFHGAVIVAAGDTPAIDATFVRRFRHVVRLAVAKR